MYLPSKERSHRFDLTNHVFDLHARISFFEVSKQGCFFGILQRPQIKVWLQLTRAKCLLPESNITIHVLFEFVCDCYYIFNLKMFVHCVNALPFASSFALYKKQGFLHIYSFKHWIVSDRRTIVEMADSALEKLSAGLPFERRERFHHFLKMLRSGFQNPCLVQDLEEMIFAKKDIWRMFKGAIQRHSKLRERYEIVESSARQAERQQNAAFLASRKNELTTLCGLMKTLQKIFEDLFDCLCKLDQMIFDIWKYESYFDDLEDLLELADMDIVQT